MRESWDRRQVDRLDDGALTKREAQRKALIASISRRLRPVCSQMPIVEFDAMVRDMADIELKYADQTAPTHVDRAD
jgi:hypothetical protein